ncbi:hypothetical protein [Neisseria sp.]|uniref:hypothetical protein n=1 Tax=Neisseria sp. TaxID=192066 RepID=UPI00359F3EE8
MMIRVCFESAHFRRRSEGAKDMMMPHRMIETAPSCPVGKPFCRAIGLEVCSDGIYRLAQMHGNRHNRNRTGESYIRLQ